MLYLFKENILGFEMKKTIIILLLLTISSAAFPQSGWIQTTDSIPDLVIMSMQFTSENTGYAVGS